MLVDEISHPWREIYPAACHGLLTHDSIYLFKNSIVSTIIRSSGNCFNNVVNLIVMIEVISWSYRLSICKYPKFRHHNWPCLHEFQWTLSLCLRAERRLPLP